MALRPLGELCDLEGREAMGDGTHIVKLSDGSSIEVPTGWPFRPDEKGYTGVTQSALFVLNNEEFEPMAMCEVHFKSLGKDYDDICDDGAARPR